MIEVVVVTPSGEAFRADVDSVVLPGSEGEFEVLEHHERFLAPLKVGTMQVKQGGSSIWGAIAGGFADVNGHQVVVLAESAEHGDDIDVARAELAEERAREGLAALGADAERARIEEYNAALERARARLAASKQGRG